MKNLFIVLTAFLYAGCFSSVTRMEKKILIYANSAAWSDSTNAPILEKFSALLPEGVSFDTTSNVSNLQEENIQKYSALVFLNTGLEELNPRNHADIQRYVESGSGVLGINATIKSPYYWAWLNKKISDRVLDKVEFVKDSDGTITEKIIELIGDNKFDYSHAKTMRAPNSERYIRQVLSADLNEPMNMDIFPNGKVLFVERRGEIKLYNPETESTKLIDKFDVRLTGNYEDGLAGVAIDPDYAENHWIYFYYAPINTDIYSLARFEFVDDSLIRDSEIMVMEVKVQIETCCHSAGDVIFGPDKLLYVSTGDNTSSKESDGYSPIDERAGRAPFDAQKSSGNANDLRGKILRIKPESDGTYSIPDGNLFPVGTGGTRPEIYAMGLRNPFRFTVHQKHNDVYWGEVGPDSGNDSEKYGPRSVDEFNRAKVAGNFGWPYFQGNSQPFPNRDFESDTKGDFFNPKAPKNESPNNTGIVALPPTNDALIWYPYAQSDLFPMLGTGSRSATGGPFYYSDEHPTASNLKFSPYYDGKWFIYDWARDWVKVVTFDENDEMVKIESFWDENEWHKPIDMKFGPDGSMYVLEYGSNYFSKNPEAALIKISYAEENLDPHPRISGDKILGAAPLTVNFSAKESFDYDKTDKLSYEWVFEGGSKDAEGMEASHTFNKPGVYTVKLTAKDGNGGKATENMTIKVGNDVPTLSIEIDGNQTYFFANEKRNYKVKVNDTEDGESSDKAYVNFTYLDAGLDLALLKPNTIINSNASSFKGKAFIEGSDCKTCHSMDKKSIGPTYLQIAEKYDAAGIDMLAQKIIDGGSGNWGHSLMAAHPQLKKTETTQMVNYILSMAGDAASDQGLSNTGLLDIKSAFSDESSYVLQAMYTDKGANDIEPLTASKIVLLKNPKQRAELYDVSESANNRSMSQGGGPSSTFLSSSGAYFGFKHIDMTGINSVGLKYANNIAGTIYVKIGGPDGKIITQKSIRPMVFERFNFNYAEINLPLSEKLLGFQDLFIVVDGDFEGRFKFAAIEWLNFKK